MKKTFSFIALLISINKIAFTQLCTVANTPDIGPDTTLIIKCNNDVTNLTTIYSTLGLTTQYDIASPTAAKIGYHKLIVTNGNGCKDTAYITIKHDVKKWTGLFSSDWHDPANWADNKVPNENTHVIIPAFTQNPCVVSTEDVSVASIKVMPNGDYKLNNGRKLNITGLCDILPVYYELSPVTKLIDNPTSETIESVDSEKIVFKGTTAQLASLSFNDIILSGPATNAPFGFLRRVLFVNISGNSYEVITQNVSLEEAFKNLYVQTSKTFNNNDTLLSRQQNANGLLSFSVPFLNVEIDPGLTINGNMEVTPTLSTTFDISNNNFHYAKMEAGFERVLTLGMSATSSTHHSGRRDIYSKNLTPILIEGGLITIVPVFRVTIGGEASSDVSLSTSIVNTSTVSAYVERQITTVWQTGSNSTSETVFNPPALEGNATIKVYVEPAIDFKLYGQSWAKGSIAVQAYSQAEAKWTPPSPVDCRLSYGLQASAAINLQMFGINYAATTYPDILSYNKILYKCRLPKVITSAITNIANYTASGGGNVTDSGESGIKKRGICWSRSHNPTLNDDNTSDGVLTGNFTSNITLLRQNTAYYVRAYVINNTEDTAYGNEVSFTTLKDSTNSLRSYTYSLYTWRYGASIPGLMNQAYENNPVYSYVGKMTLHFDSDISFTQKQYDSSGNLYSGGLGSYSIGSFFPDSLFYAETGSDSSNSYGHHYPEGWGLKIPPGIEIKFFNSFGTPSALPSRMSVDNQFIYMMQGGDMIWKRDD